MMRFFGLFSGNSYFMLKILLRFSNVSFHIVCANTTWWADHLTYEWPIDDVILEKANKVYHIFSKLSSALLEVVLFIHWMSWDLPFRHQTRPSRDPNIVYVAHSKSYAAVLDTPSISVVHLIHVQDRNRFFDLVCQFRRRACHAVPPAHPIFRLEYRGHGCPWEEWQCQEVFYKIVRPKFILFSYLWRLVFAEIKQLLLLLLELVLSLADFQQGLSFDI